MCFGHNTDRTDKYPDTVIHLFITNPLDLSTLKLLSSVLEPFPQHIEISFGQISPPVYKCQVQVTRSGLRKKGLKPTWLIFLESCHQVSTSAVVINGASSRSVN